MLAFVKVPTIAGLRHSDHVTDTLVIITRNP